jgi:hypothetical protein
VGVENAVVAAQEQAAPDHWTRAEPEFTCPSEESSMWLFLREKATQRACRWVRLFWFCCNAPQDHLEPVKSRQWRTRHRASILPLLKSPGRWARPPGLLCSRHRRPPLRRRFRQPADLTRQ